MKLLGLPGRDEATVAWLGEILNGLTGARDSVIVQRYGCWEDGGELDLQAEITKAGAVAPDLVVAKSLGTRVTLHAAIEGALAAPGYVLIGIPLAAYSEDEVAMLNALCGRARVLVIQQTDDFLGGFAEVQRRVTAPSAVLEEVPGSDHVYSDTDALVKLIRAWLDAE
jgi:predicted alpha/beta-hydrolase family hydrolase